MDRKLRGIGELSKNGSILWRKVPMAMPRSLNQSVAEHSDAYV